MKKTPLRQTPFKRKPYQWKPKTNKRKESKNIIPEDTRESKLEEWNRIREELKERFLAAGIISCELKLEGCTRAYNFGWTWSFAHSKKRGDISTEPEQRELEMRQVIYCCQKCHATAESLGNKYNEMYNLIMSIINNRDTQP